MWKDKEPLTAVGSRTLPLATPERRPALAALAVLLILGGALATTILVTGAAGQEGRLLAQNALVDSVSSGRDRTQPLVTVIVDSSLAPSIAAYASSGQIAITELPGGR
jgi:hypothetical protein